MSLTDREILELNEICNAVIDETLTDTQRTRLSAWLKESEDARQFYVRALGQSASLHEYAGETHAEAPSFDVAPKRRTPGKIIQFSIALAVAASLALGFWFSWPKTANDVSPANGKSSVYVARLSAARETKWTGSELLQPGAL